MEIGYLTKKHHDSVTTLRDNALLPLPRIGADDRPRLCRASTLPPAGRAHMMVAMSISGITADRRACARPLSGPRRCALRRPGARRPGVRPLALLLLLSLGVMEYAHLEYHRHTDRHADHSRLEPDRHHALFHCGAFAEAPPVLLDPLRTRAEIVRTRPTTVPLREPVFQLDPRAPPALV